MKISQSTETVKQLSYAAPAYRSTMSINAGMTGSAICKFGTSEQKAHWLPRIASSEIDCGDDILRKAAACKMFATETCGPVADRRRQIYENTRQIKQLQIAKHMLREFASDGAVW